MNALLGGFLADAEALANLAGGLPLEEAQEDGVAVGSGQFCQSRIQVRRDLVPEGGFVVRRVGLGLHGEGGLFALATAGFGADQIGCDVTGGEMEPRGKRCTVVQPCRHDRGVLCEGHEDGLGRVLREMGIQHQPSGRGVDEIDVASHQLPEGTFVVGVRVSAQEFAIRPVLHQLLVTAAIDSGQWAGLGPRERTGRWHGKRAVGGVLL